MITNSWANNLNGPVAQILAKRWTPENIFNAARKIAESATNVLQCAWEITDIPALDCSPTELATLVQEINPKITTFPYRDDCEYPFMVRREAI